MLFDLYLTHKGSATLIYFLKFLIVFKILNFSVNITVKWPGVKGVPSELYGTPAQPSTDMRPDMLSLGFISPFSKAVCGCALSGRRERLSRWTPKNVTAKPHSRETVLLPSVVLMPWNRIKDATRVAVENPT